MMRFLIGLACLALSTGLHAAGPTTYKCVTGKKVEYSDSPCVGATVVDTTPNEGLDKLSGKARVGRDVQLEQHRRLMNEMIRPVTGMSDAQMSLFQRRYKLPAAVQAECRNLDQRIAEEREPVALYQARKRHKDLAC